MLAGFNRAAAHNPVLVTDRETRCRSLYPITTSQHVIMISLTQQRRLPHILLGALVALVMLLSRGTQSVAAQFGTSSSNATNLTDPAIDSNPLAPNWRPGIRNWGPIIGPIAADSGIDPDFVAAVINEESNGVPDGISRVGAVGLMGVMPTGPGLEWRPETDELLDPEVNLRWGVAILADIVRQSGGDIFAALAAYAGGWDQASKRVPREYAEAVLDNYARAVIARTGQDPDIAVRWTIAVSIQRGNIPPEPLLMGLEPLSDLQTYGEHLVYQYVGLDGRSYYVRGYAVPIAVVVPPQMAEPAGTFGLMDPQLMARQGLVDIAKVDKGNPRVVVACLPSISRLRGTTGTRWFAPADCPSWHR